VLDFNPPDRRFLWEEDIHREEFRFRTPTRHDGARLRGSLLIYLNYLLIAELPLDIRVDNASADPLEDCRAVPEYARRYRKIFVSYSHEDHEIVRRVTELARAMGDRFVRDVSDLRAGQDWNAALLRMIDDADIFQLFWSTNFHELSVCHTRMEVCAVALSGELRTARLLAGASSDRSEPQPATTRTATAPLSPTFLL
jgi:hypothetical protein